MSTDVVGRKENWIEKEVLLSLNQRSKAKLINSVLAQVEHTFGTNFLIVSDSKNVIFVFLSPSLIEELRLSGKSISSLFHQVISLEQWHISTPLLEVIEESYAKLTSFGLTFPLCLYCSKISISSQGYRRTTKVSDINEVCFLSLNLIDKFCVDRIH
jgi:hypothetical protein